VARDPIQPTDDDARALARGLLKDARTAALAVLLDDGTPMATRIAFGLAPDGAPLSLISDLAAHTKALRAEPDCSLLIGEVTGKGDPLNLPRLTLQASAQFTPPEDKDRLAGHYLETHPKAKLYVGFADFHLVRFRVSRGHLNGGFGQAYTLTPQDMGLPG